MAYSMLNTKTFIELIKNGEYETKTGARRALGKAKAIPEKDKATCHKAIDEYFGDDEDSKPKKTKKEKKVTTKAAKTAKPKQKIERSPRKKVQTSSREENVAQEQSIVIGPVLPTDYDVNSVTSQLKIAEKIIQNVSHIMHVFLAVKSSGEEVEVTETMSQAAITMSGAISILDRITNRVANAMLKAEEPVNGSSGKALFHESVPTVD